MDSKSWLGGYPNAECESEPEFENSLGHGVAPASQWWFPIVLGESFFSFAFLAHWANCDAPISLSVDNQALTELSEIKGATNGAGHAG